MSKIAGENSVSSFLKDFLGVGFARITASFCGLVVSLLLTYTFGATEAERTANYGTYQLFFRVVGLLSVLGGGWLAAGVLRYGTDEYVETGTLRKTFGISAPIFFLSNLILICGILFFWDNIRTYFELPATLAGDSARNLLWGYAIVFNLILILPSFFQASRRMLWYGFLPVVPIILYTILIGVIRVTHLSLSPLLAISCLFSLNLGVMLFGILRLLPSVLPPRWSGEHAGKIIGFSYPLLFSQIAGQVILSIDVLALNKAFNDEKMVGVYSIAYLIFNNVGQIAIVVTSLMVPLVITMLAKKQEGEIDRFVHRIGPQMGWMWAFLCGGLMLLAREMIAIFPGGFAAGGPILIVLLLALCVRVTTMVDSPVFNAYALIPSMAAFSVVAAATQVLSVALLVPRYGMYGAAWANCVTAAVGMALRVGWLYYRRGYNTATSLAPLWPLLVVWPVAFFVESWWIRLLVIPVFLAVHVLYGRTAGLFTPDSLEIVDRIRMPERWRAGVHLFYRWMNP